MRKYVIGGALIVLTSVVISVYWLLGVLKLPARSAISLSYYGFLCRVLRVRVRVVGKPVRDAPVLLVGNHVSWLDIPIIGSIVPVAFVAKREVADWPLIGLCARVQGCVFVDRKRRHRTTHANAEIARLMAAGRPVMLFAEGTSSDGNRVLPFRSALFGAVKDALAAGIPAGRLQAQPISICYTRQYGLPLGRQHRPLVAWYGDLDLVPHLADFLTRGVVDAVLTFGAPIPYAGDADRKIVVKNLEQTVRQITSETLREWPQRAG